MFTNYVSVSLCYTRERRYHTKSSTTTHYVLNIRRSRCILRQFVFVLLLIAWNPWRFLAFYRLFTVSEAILSSRGHDPVSTT
jgi:hypothetical protein